MDAVKARRLIRIEIARLCRRARIEPTAEIIDRLERLFRAGNGARDEASLIGTTRLSPRSKFFSGARFPLTGAGRPRGGYSGPFSRG